MWLRVRARAGRGGVRVKEGAREDKSEDKSEDKIDAKTTRSRSGYMVAHIYL